MKITIGLLILLTLQISAIAQTDRVSTLPAPVDCAAEKTRADRAEARLKDWPNLGRYREANSKVAAPVKDEDRVVFMGDSITDVWKFDQYFPGKPFINRGISGQTTPQMLLRFRPDVIALKPKVVVILAGTNDLSANTGPTTPEVIEGNLASMVEMAQSYGIRVVLASILPVSDHNKDKAGKQIIRTGTRPPDQILLLNQWMKNYAAEKGEKGVVYLDYFSATVDDKGFLKEDLADDGLHPNAKGYEVMKPLVLAAIDKALKMKVKKK